MEPNVHRGGNYLVFSRNDTHVQIIGTVWQVVDGED